MLWGKRDLPESSPTPALRPSHAGCRLPWPHQCSASRSRSILRGFRPAANSRSAEWMHFMYITRIPKLDQWDELRTPAAGPSRWAPAWSSFPYRLEILPFPTPQTPQTPTHAGKLLFDSVLTESSCASLPNTKPAYKNMVLLRSNCFKRSNCITLGPFAAPLRQTLSTSSRNLPSPWIRSRCSASGKAAARPQIPGWDGRGVKPVPKPYCRLPAGARTTSRGFI